MKPKTLYKLLRTGLKSEKSDHAWKIGEWYHEDNIDICHKGFHASKTPLQAFGYVGGEILATVKVKGEHIVEDDNECWSDMCLVNAYPWTKEDSVELAIYSAELIIDIYEKKYPNDGRPRKAIDASKAYLVTVKSGDENAAADAARYARVAARDARYAHDAVRDARSAADAADVADAVRAAADAAYAAYAAANIVDNIAANAAFDAADAAARAANVNVIDKWFIKKIKTLTPIV